MSENSAAKSSSSNSLVSGTSCKSKIPSDEAGIDDPRVRSKRHRKKSPRDLLIEAQKAEEESMLYNLTLDVNNLKQEIRQLTVHRNLLQQRERNTDQRRLDTIVSTIRMYFDGFKHGYRDCDCAQREYVRSIVSDTFALGVTPYGVDMLLEQWNRYTVVFAITDVELISSKCVVGITCDYVVFRCAAMFQGFFTQLAVNTVFPNARSHLWQLLQVLGSRLVCPMLFHVYFDLNGSFMRQDLVADFFSAITNLLGGDFLLACCFLEGSKIGEESMIESPETRV